VRAGVIQKHELECDTAQIMKGMPEKYRKKCARERALLERATNESSGLASISGSSARD